MPGLGRFVEDFETVVAFPEKFSETVMAGSQPYRVGFDGIQPWATPQGAEDEMGLPKIQLLLPAVQWRARYTEAHFLGQRRLGKRESYVVRARVRGQAGIADYYYDASTFLLLQVETVAGWAMRITYRISEYQNVSGFKVPREWTIGSNRTVLKSVKINIDIPDTEFEKPK